MVEIGAVGFVMLQDVIHKRILDMFGHLRKYTLYFLEYRQGQHTPRQIAAAQQEIAIVAKFAEDHLQGSMITMLMHRAVVHIPEQAMMCGPTAFLCEEFGERCIRRFCSHLAHHSTNDVAKSAAATALREMGLRKQKAEHEDIDAPLIRAKAVQPNAWSDKGDAHGTQLQRLWKANTGLEGDEVRHRNCHCTSCI